MSKEAVKEEDSNEEPNPVQYYSEDEPGLVEALGTFLDGGNESEEIPKEKPSEKPAQKEKETDKEPDKETTEDISKEVEEEPEDPKVEPEGIFGDEHESEEKPKDAFDEESFDVETDKMLKALEEKGHPGDVYKKLRSELKELKQSQEQTKVPEDVETELNDLRQKAQEIDGLREKLEEVSSVSAKVRVEQSDEYKKEVLEPASQILHESKDLAESYGVSEDSLNAIIVEGDRKRRNEMIEKTLEDFSEMDRQDVYSMIRKYQNLQGTRKQMLSDAEKIIEKRDQNKQDLTKQEYEEQRKQFRNIQDTLWDKYQDVIPGLSDAEGSDQLDKLKRKAMSIDMSKGTAKDEAFAAFSGVLLPHLVKELHKANRKLSEFETNEEKQSRRSPRATPAVASKSEEGEEDDFMTLLNKRFK